MEKKFGIRVGGMYWLQNYNEQGHEDGHCITGRDSEDAVEFDSVAAAQDIIDDEPELLGAEILPLD